jgi:hypothetical protein
MLIRGTRAQSLSAPFSYTLYTANTAPHELAHILIEEYVRERLANI